MRILTHLKKLVFLILSLLTICSSQSFAKEDTILAVVNQEIVTLNDLKGYLDSLYLRLRAQGLSDAEIQKEMAAYQREGLKKLIEEKLMILEADRLGLIIQPKAVEDRLNEVRRQYASEREFLDTVIAEGLTITDLKNKITNDMKIRFIIDREVKDKIFVNPQEVTAYYEQNQKQFINPEHVELESIGISFQNGQDAAQKKAKEAVDFLKNNDHFKEATQKYSDLPPITKMSKGQMLQDIEDVVFSLKLSEISKPVSTKTGLYIFKLIAKHPEEPLPLSDVRDKITSALFQEKYQNAFKIWLSKLRDKVFIEIKN